MKPFVIIQTVQGMQISANSDYIANNTLDKALINLENATCILRNESLQRYLTKKELQIYKSN